jgi:hypothetical protein
MLVKLRLETVGRRIARKAEVDAPAIEVRSCLKHLTCRILGFELPTSVARTPLTLPESHFESKKAANIPNFMRRPQSCTG